MATRAGHAVVPLTFSVDGEAISQVAEWVERGH
ncbi:hypothetical protein FHS23_002580 [Prauserella isguenensis]|uniref:Uncharacterized protein n=1 Tax=Prauserella isguenensis TaxID=1470180 RepID=A0A839S4E5_9PSEU|nr:hypothetical protein [Prauserella isguenensis]